MALEKASAKSSNIVLHDNVCFRPQKLNTKGKNEPYFYMQKEFLGYLFSARKNSISVKKVLPKLSLSQAKETFILLKCILMLYTIANRELRA